MASIILEPESQIQIDPADWTRLAFDWSSHFAAGAQLLSDSALLASFEVEDVTVPPEIQEVVPTLLVSDSAFSTGSNNLIVLFSLKGGIRGHVYRVRHYASTTENPTQKRKRSIYVWVKTL